MPTTITVEGAFTCSRCEAVYDDLDPDYPVRLTLADRAPRLALVLRLAVADAEVLAGQLWAAAHDARRAAERETHGKERA